MNIDKLTKNVNNLSASKDGKNKVCYLVFKAAQAVVEIYRKDKVVDSFANYVSDTESVIGIKTYRLKTEEDSSLKVFNFDLIEAKSEYTGYMDNGNKRIEKVG